MKYRESILLFLFIYFCLCSCFAQSITNGLIALYSFDEAPSSRLTQQIKDSSSHKNDGHFVGTINYVKNRFGVDCRAVSFDGNSYITVPNSSSLSSPTNQFTAAVWVKIASGADLFTQWLTILCKSDDLSETISSPHYRVQATAQTISVNTDFTEVFMPQLSYDVWYFYAYVYDGSKVKVYLDGQFVFEYNFSGRLYPNTMPLEIGRDRPGAVEYFKGVIDDLKIYNRALSKYELDQLFNDRSEFGLPSACTTNQTGVSSNSNPIATSGTTITIPPNDPIYDNTDDEQLTAASTEEDTEDSIDDKLLVAEEEEEEEEEEDPVDDNYEGLPNVIDKIPVDYQQTIIVRNEDIKIYPYDNEKEDGDVVSININGVWVRDYFQITNKKPAPNPSDYIRFSLNSEEDNYIISKAWNIGSIPPNTLTIEIDDGVSVQEVIINSEIGKSGGIRIINRQE